MGVDFAFFFFLNVQKFCQKHTQLRLLLLLNKTLYCCYLGKHQTSYIGIVVAQEIGIPSFFSSSSDKLSTGILCSKHR